MLVILAVALISILLFLKEKTINRGNSLLQNKNLEKEVIGKKDLALNYNLQTNLNP